MLGFITRRLLAGVVLVAAITTIAYTLLYIGGVDIARNLMGEYATQEQVAQKAAQLGLDQPLSVRYLEWVGSAITGDLGRSWFTSEPVLQSLMTRLPVTLSLVIGTAVVTAIVSAVIGVVAAVKGGWVDRSVQTLALIGHALPSFIIVIILVVIFAVQLRWFPATGYVSFLVSPSEWLRTVTLPIIAISLGGIAAVSTQVRGSMIDILDRDFIRTLRASGIRSRSVIAKHALRNAAGPALTVLSLQFISLLGGAVIVEKVFALPGIGALAVSATTSGDIPVVMGIVLVAVVMVIVVNLLVDLINGWLNPKVRLS